MPIEFKKFDSIARLSRPMIITEKIDGCNMQVIITEEGEFATASRNKFITPEDDTFGFSKWAHENKEELMKLGPGRHFGEWWGPGIQRGYGLRDKKWSLFNVHKWTESRPACCEVVPTLYTGMFDTNVIEKVLTDLCIRGSVASPGFMRPEGIVVYHKASGTLFKKTIENDESGKGNG